jgi:hypothetical protein
MIILNVNVKNYLWVRNGLNNLVQVVAMLILMENKLFHTQTYGMYERELPKRSNNKGCLNIIHKNNYSIVIKV